MNTQVLITYREYKTLPESGPRYQLIEGDLLMSPAPKPPHQRIVGRLFWALHSQVIQQGNGEAIVSPIDVVLSDTNVLQPDIVYVSPRRRKIIKEDGLFGAPDICVEVISASSREQDLGVKHRLYARFGVREYWVVDPKAKRVMVFSLTGNPAGAGETFGVGATLRSEVLPHFSLDVNQLFG